ncbi:MAG: 7TM-DISM domain-containing protein [Burkholderiaceae bacterium]|nr:7TM-DISM domain-containing protein [Burkholderiaceae bacterium]
MKIATALQLWLALLVLTGLAQPAYAGLDLIQHRSYLEDPEGKQTIQDIQTAQGWKPFTEILPLRNKGIPFWIRLEVKPAPEEGWALRVQPGILQDIQVFQRRHDGAWAVERAGSGHPYQARERSELAYTFNYHSTPGEVATVFVRVQSASAIAHFKIISPSESRDFDTQTHVFIGLYMGFGLVVMCISALSWRVTNQRIWGLNAGFDLLTFVLVSLQTGVVAKYLLSHSETVPEQVNLVANSLHLAMACLLFRGMMRLFQASAWCTLAYSACIWLLPVQLVLISLGQGAKAMSLNSMEILLVSLWGGVAVWFVPIKDRLLSVLFKSLNTCLAIYLVLWLAPALLPFRMPSYLSLYPALPSNFFTMLMTLVVMARHTQLETQRQRLIERHKQETDLALTYEKQRHAETNSFLSMVLHELKNPLSLLRVGTKNLELDTAPAPEARAARFAKIQRAIESIDAILERCVEVDHLEQGTLSVQPHDEDITELLTECVEQTSVPHRIVLHLMPRAHAYVDGVLLRLMVRNLLDNALRYGAQDAPVTLRLAQTDKALQITVSNPPGRGGRPDPDKLFRKYYRAPSALFASGTGLGLYWVSQVSQLMNTTVRYVPDEHLVIFELCLPN